ncbi:hypothetical protein HYPSUDRAFT_199591 [Hypholoma sublateritium FD-334 SS-4]|uniref:Uncharacterized protein n=1 Tax=Hypholoma sublateritium (strain FD-334 SS-4) TaxID=945553 RepID=A0A0D2P3E3_HYPSF|nr:hypothetical protein HYPSUDRAFT_199591 [Hypholoma sublateritium FD-334 SS-4]
MAVGNSIAETYGLRSSSSNSPALAQISANPSTTALPMDDSVVDSPAAASPTDKYDIDDTPLTQEEEEVVAKMEESYPTSSNVPPSVSPSRKKRKRASSASPHLTPSRLRSSVKVTARAMDAGYKPNNNHSFRQELPSDTAGSAPSNSEAIVAGADHSWPSESAEPAIQHVAQLIRGSDHPGNRSSVPTDETRRSQSIGPSIPQPPIQQGVYGYTRGIGDHSGLYHPYPQMPPSADDARRSQSIGPTAPPGVHGYTGGMGDHTGPYHMYPQMPPSAMPQQYGAYPGMSGLTSYFQPAGPAYTNAQSLQFYQQPPTFHDQNLKVTRPPPEMPTEGPNPSANVFSPHYTSGDSHQAAQGSALRPSSAQPSSSTHTLGSTPTRSSSSTHTPPKPTPSELTPRPASGPAAAEPAKLPADDPAATRISIQPSTPLSIQNCDAGGSSSKLADAVSTLEESPTIGRMTNTARQALQEGFAELDGCIRRISAKTGLNPAQIVERWDVTKTRVTNSWNLYQGFFEEKRDQELARLDPEVHPHSGAIPKKAAISACYELFKLSKPDTYDQILRSWYKLHLMTETGDMSMSKRTRNFRKHAEKIEALIRHGSSHHGFESLCIIAGGVINQDQNLAQLVGSDAAIDFFLERYRSSDSEALGHMKAHVYDRLSKRMVSEDRDEKSPLAVVKKEQTAAGETAIPSIQDLKEKFIALAARYKVVVTKGQALLWKALPHAIAEAGCVLHNWPEDVPFPCDESQTGKTASKGISILKLPARALLFAAFDHPTYPLHFERKSKTSVPGDDPVIIGVPPSPSSSHTHGRRKFLDDNQNEDRKGPPRRKATADTKSSVTPQKAPARTSKQKAPPSPPKKVGFGGELDEPADPIRNSDEERMDAPKTSMKNTASTSKKIRVQFVVPDESDSEVYQTSEDGAAQYSGTDDDAPIVRSPHRLRSKRSSVKAKKPQGSTKRASSSSKRRQTSFEENEEIQDSNGIEASTADISTKKSAPSVTANKKCRVTPTTAPTADDRTATAGPTPSIAKSTARTTSANLTVPTKDISAGGHNLTDKLAEQLFGNAHRSSLKPDSAASLPSPTIPLVPSDPSIAPAVAANAPAPRQQNEDQQRVSHMQVPRHEGYYAPHHPVPFAESYNGYYGSSEHPPPSWNMGPGMGWYPAGPGSAVHPPASGGPMGGPGHHPGYWQRGPPFPNPYGHYLQPGAPPSHRPQDNGSREHGDRM